ncbi:hypothetical protein [Microseira sp. BLCC-F43]
MMSEERCVNVLIWVSDRIPCSKQPECDRYLFETGLGEAAWL